MTLAIQICSGSEWRAIKKIFKIRDDQVRPQPYGEFFITPLLGYNCILFNSRKTKTRAAGAAQFAISSWTPRALINLGTCTATSEGLHIGSIILANKTIQFDCIDRITEHPEQIWEQMSTELDLNWLPWQPQREDFFTGTIGSGDQDITYAQMAQIKDFSILGTDWESAAIAKVCELNGVRCAVLRGTTDLAHTQSDFSHLEQHQKNTPIIMEKLFALLPDLIRHIHFSPTT